MNLTIDTNYLRKRELAEALQGSAPSHRFVVPDTTVLETMKTPEWESTARQSFEIIARYPARIVTATESSRLMLEELEGGKDIIGVVDARLSLKFRTFIQELASGREGPALRYVRDNIVEAQETLQNQQLDHVRNLVELKSIRDAVKMEVKLKAYRALPDEEKRWFLLRLAKTSAVGSIRQAVEAEGMGSEISASLVSGRGIIMRHGIGYFLLGFKWAINNGLDNLKDWKATNERMDLDQAVIGSYSDGILTDEASVSQLRQDILDALEVEPLEFATEESASEPPTSTL